jgi:hypothetical protein
MRTLVALALVIIAAVAPAAASEVKQSPDNLRDLFAYLRQCVRQPAGSEGSEITLRFGLTHYGALKGPPMITHSRLIGDLASRKAFVAASLAALQNCTPVPVTEAFGRVVSQTVLTWRIRSGPEQRHATPAIHVRMRTFTPARMRSNVSSKGAMRGAACLER